MYEFTRNLAILFSLLLSLNVNAQMLRFANSAGQVDIPTGYGHYFEERGKTLVLVPETQKKVEIRLSYFSLREYVKQRPNIGKDMVQDGAKKRGKNIFTVNENSGVAFIDFTESKRTSSGEQLQNTHGMMGLDDAYVTFTITAADEAASSSLVKGLVSGGIKVLLARVSSKGV